FSFNIVALDSDEAGSMGLDTRTVRLVSIVLGSVMAAAAMIHCGMVAMVSLIVPFLSRGIFGVESRRLFWGNLLLGGLMLLLCKDIAALIPFPGEGMPVGAIVELVAIPAFIAVLATRRRTWE
ncbi:MAG: iron chelate uptake ABC transporter family permease subunit, partial [Clostridiales Family XIII bacterium]|nr:iron chelate uptake ABC transporter family permease subunit [Clostridiales Family XIII bacterium]